MYIPPLKAIAANLNLEPAALNGQGPVVVPAPFIKFLLQLVIANGHFNEDGYLKSNPDVASAAARGQLGDPRVHYIRYGFFEGRLGATPEVDEQWYRRAYADVASAVSSGAIASASAHFSSIGCVEGRSPSSAYEADSSEWKRVLGSSGAA